MMICLFVCMFTCTDDKGMLRSWVGRTMEVLSVNKRQKAQQRKKKQTNKLYCVLFIQNWLIRFEANYRNHDTKIVVDAIEAALIIYCESHFSMSESCMHGPSIYIYMFYRHTSVTISIDLRYKEIGFGIEMLLPMCHLWL